MPKVLFSITNTNVKEVQSKYLRKFYLMVCLEELKLCAKLLHILALIYTLKFSNLS